MKKENSFVKILLAVFGLSSYLHANSLYGQASLRALPGVELFVHCAGDFEIKKLEDEIRGKLKKRLENANVPIIAYNTPNNGGALKFLLTGFKKEEDSYFIYASLQLHQRAYLAVSHEYMDCQTWDIWKMGIFSKNEIFLEAEDMIREFVNDFISANGF
ncbi:MAG: hypothetical protein LBC64_07645 [Fibromonadaceae bacterium]|nr:hypothetical protein [Fibromonadaceae bacterium]